MTAAEHVKQIVCLLVKNLKLPEKDELIISTLSLKSCRMLNRKRQASTERTAEVIAVDKRRSQIGNYVWH